MNILALTGGIATGKSTILKLLQHLDSDLVSFDCDQSVQGLLERGEVIDSIAHTFGEEMKEREGKLNRKALRERVFRAPEERKKLESILHPLVREECLEKLELSRKTTPSSLFIADVPLLFESGFDFGQESCLVVATSEKTQRMRLKERNGFDDNLITSIIAAQLPILEKVALADVVFWNEGPPHQLKCQLSRFLKTL